MDKPGQLELFISGRQSIWWKLHEKLYPKLDGTMPIWIDGYCVMRSPIAKSDRIGDTANITALPRVPGNPGWTDEPCIISNFYGRYRSKAISNSKNT